MRAAKDHGDLVGLTEGAVGVQESLAQGIEGNAAMENEIIAILNLSKEETMLTTGLFALFFREERSETIQPLPTADEQIARVEGIGEFLKPLGVAATQERVGGLLKVDVLLLHEVMLHDPALGQLQVPAIVLFVSDGGQNASWFSCL